MKKCIFLFLIAALFIMGSWDSPEIQNQFEKLHQVFETKQKQQTQTNIITVTDFYIGEHKAQNIYIGKPVDFSEYDVVALWPNYEEVDELEKPALFTRANLRQTSITDIRLNSKFVRVNTFGKVLSWNYQVAETPIIFLDSLTSKLIEADSNIVAANYKVRPIDRDNFVLEDIQFIYRQGYLWNDIEIEVKVIRFDGSAAKIDEKTKYRLNSV